MTSVHADASVSLLTLADSEIARVTRRGDEWCLLFSAVSCTHTTHTPHGPQTLSGYLLAVELLGSHGEVRALGDACFGRLSKGLCMAEGVVWRALPLHQTLNGNLVLELEFANGSVLALSAHRMQWRTTNATRFMESLAC